MMSEQNEPKQNNKLDDESEQLREQIARSKDTIGGNRVKHEEEEPISRESASLHEDGLIMLHTVQCLPSGIRTISRSDTVPGDEGYEETLHEWGLTEIGQVRTLVKKWVNGKWSETELIDSKPSLKYQVIKSGDT
jgi:hypothetical protein